MDGAGDARRMGSYADTIKALLRELRLYYVLYGLRRRRAADGAFCRHY